MKDGNKRKIHTKKKYHIGLNRGLDSHEQDVTHFFNSDSRSQPQGVITLDILETHTGYSVEI